MTELRKPFSRYIYNRGLHTLWKGDPAVPGSFFRSVALTSDQFNSSVGRFQVIALEGVGRGVIDGKFAGSEEYPKVLGDFDEDTLKAAGARFDALVKDALTNGFETMSFMDMLEYEAKLR